MADTKVLQAILDKVKTIDVEVRSVRSELKETRNSLTKRIDKIGLQLANLEDDAPTNDEFEKLTKRVTKLETRVFKN